MAVYYNMLIILFCAAEFTVGVDFVSLFRSSFKFWPYMYVLMSVLCSRVCGKCYLGHYTRSGQCMVIGYVLRVLCHIGPRFFGGLVNNRWLLGSFVDRGLVFTVSPSPCAWFGMMSFVTSREVGSAYPEGSGREQGGSGRAGKPSIWGDLSTCEVGCE